jgi:hypothetical protein
MKKKISNYNSDITLQNVPLRVDEIENLSITIGELSADELRHLLSRILVSMKEQRKKINDLQYEVEKFASQNSLVGHPMQISIDVLNKLTPAELDGVLDARYLKSLSELDSEKENMEQQRLLLYSEVNRVKFILATILNDSNYSEDLKDRLKSILESYNVG